MGKIRLTSWADFCYITTLLYSIFVLCGFFIDFNCQVDFYGKVYETKLNWFTYLQIVNENLKEWKLYLMLTCLLFVSIVIDRVLLIPMLFRKTKEGKILKMERNKRYKELKDEKKQKDIR